MQKTVNVEEWVALFREVGLGDTEMKRWHVLFEERHPEAHQAFLEWLGLPQKEIEGIRSRSR